MLEIKDEIYFMQDSLSKRIKIGYTSNLKKRFQSLSGANANKLFLLGSISGTEDDEMKLHKKFIKHKVHGEWFHPSNEILDFIKQSNEEEDENKEFKGKVIYNVSQVAKVIGLSRARFYQLLNGGFFPKPLYDKRTKRPYYTSSLVKQIKEVRKTNVGINDEICLFYNPR